MTSQVCTGEFHVVGLVVVVVAVAVLVIVDDFMSRACRSDEFKRLSLDAGPRVQLGR